MKRRRSNRIILSFAPPVFIALSWCNSSSASAPFPKQARVVDLSYRHYRDAASIASNVRDRIWEKEGEEEKDNISVNVDVSSSLLGDDGVEKIIDALFERRDVTTNAIRSVNLSARMNRLTPSGASRLFERLGKYSKAATLTTENKEVEEGNDKPSESGSSTSEVEPSEETPESTGTVVVELASNHPPDGDRNVGAAIIEDGISDVSPDEEDERTIPLTDTLNGTTTNSSTLREEDVDTKEISSASPGDTSKDLARCLYIQSLDIGLNDIGHGSGSRSFATALRKLIETDDEWACPLEIRLDRCGLGPSSCRAIGKGLINRGKTARRQQLSSLHLSGNDAIGDAGAAALAAALRTAPLPQQDTSGSVPGGGIDESNVSIESSSYPVLSMLDLSSCHIGDTGAEALAMAIEGNPGCVRNLDLSNNLISDDGAAAIGRALESNALGSIANGRPGSKKACIVESVNLSNNKDLGDRGAAAVASAIEHGALRSAFLRSCSVRADGAMAFGKAVKALSSNTVDFFGSDTEESQIVTVQIDLSGNQLGVLRAKKKGGNKYSASLLKSKASATTASYMNFIGKKIKSGLKDAGLDVSPLVGSLGASAESDDEEEELMGLEGSAVDAENGGSEARCGAKSFSEPILDENSQPPSTKDENYLKANQPRRTRCVLGMRQCSLDEEAADGLAAAVIKSKDSCGMELAVDVTLNPALDSGTVSDLRRVQRDEKRLRQMAKRHLDALEALRIARERAAEAAEAAAARARAEAALNSAWDGDEDYGEFDDVPPDDYDQYDDYGFSERDEYGEFVYD